MPFPESKRVFYGKNPLEEVVCQLRFPPILRINTEAPATFQDRVRAVFPFYQKTSTSVQVLRQLPQELAQALAGSAGTVHEFKSADRVWTLSLTRDFIALTTTGYKDWQDFKQKMGGPLEALTEIYEPAFFVRTGLRYRDRIDRDGFGLGDVNWKELLRPGALGELADETIGPHIEHVLRELIVRLTGDAGQVRIVHGLQREGDKLSYIIDSDFFTEKQTEIKAVSDVLDAFNRRAGRLFRWYITSQLHEAMLPRD